MTVRKFTAQTDQEETKPKTTWVWDRNKQSWVEIIEKSVDREISEAERTATHEPVTATQSSHSRAPAATKVERPKSGWKLLYGRTSKISAVDTFAKRDEDPELPSQTTGISTTPEDEVTRIVSEVTRETEKLARAAMGTVKEQASAALLKANEKAKVMRELVVRETHINEVEMCLKPIDPIIGDKQPDIVPDTARAVTRETEPEIIEYTAEEYARARTEQMIVRAQDIAKAEAQVITASAEEKARVHAGRIVAQAQERAKAAAQDIIARAEENTSMQVAHIIARARERAQAEAQDIILRAEENARLQAEHIVAQAQERAQAAAANIIAKAEDLGKHKLSQAEQEAQLILKSAHENAQQFYDQAEITPRAAPIAPWVPVPPVETMPPAHQPVTPVQKEIQIPYQGTAELVVAPPVDLRKMQKMLQRMITAKQVKILDLDGSAGKGISIKLFSRNLAQLPSVLESLPEVDQVSDLQLKFSRFCPSTRLCPSRQREGGQPLRRILVKMRRRNDNL
ncbi:MAG: hypothetical protein JSW38_03855, partial [Dehalococcoidia bacterium]